MNWSPLDAARQYLAAGYSLLPIALDGRKRPAGQVLPRDANGKPSWLPFQKNRPTESDLQHWHGSTVPYGIGIICGEISRRLIVLDCESEQVWLDIEREAIGQGLGDLLAGCLLSVTPSGGRHLYIHLSTGTVPSGTVLARDANRDVLVETRGAGHYVVAAGSPAAVHESGVPYQCQRWPVSVCLWNNDQLNTVLEIARSFNQYVAPECLKANPSRGTVGGGETETDSPGSTLNRIGSWPEILEPHGWRAVGTRGECVLWCRPGKSNGISATTGHCRTPGSGDLLYVFSSNATPFEPESCYSKFAAYSLLNHNGEFGAAASELRNRGIGGTQSADFGFKVTLPPADQIQPDGSVRARRYKFSRQLSCFITC